MSILLLSGREVNDLLAGQEAEILRAVRRAYEAHARNGSLRIETVKSDDGITVPLERMLAAVDPRPRRVRRRPYTRTPGEC